MILCNHSVFCCGSVFTAADCVVEPVILGLPTHVLPIIFPKAHIPVSCENPPFSPSRSHKLWISDSLLHCHSLQFWCPFKDFRTAETIPRKILLPARRIVYRMCVVTRGFLYKHPSPIEKTLPLPVSSQYVPNSLITYTPSPPPHANPFPHPPISRPSLSSYPPIPPPRTPSSRNHKSPNKTRPFTHRHSTPQQTYRLQISTSLHDGYSHAYTSTWHANHKATARYITAS